jgi:hypothetical protein
MPKKDDEGMNLDDLESELKKEQNVPDDCNCAICQAVRQYRDTGQRPKIDVVAEIISKTMIGRGGIVGVSGGLPDDDPETLTILVLKGQIKETSAGAPETVLGYNVKFREVTPRELVELSKRSDAKAVNNKVPTMAEMVSALKNDPAILIDMLRTAGMPEHMIKAYTGMVTGVSDLIMGKHRSDKGRRRMVIAQVLTASRFMSSVEPDMKLAVDCSEEEFNRLVQDEFDQIDDAELDNIEAISDVSERSFKWLNYVMKYVGPWKDRIEASQANKTPSPTNVVPPPPPGKSRYQQMMDEVNNL